MKILGEIDTSNKQVLYSICVVCMQFIIYVVKIGKFFFY